MYTTLAVSLVVYHNIMQARPKLKTFFLTIVLEGLEDKYKVQFSRGEHATLM